ncbi:MAG: branched-chain amino acid ABC transporter permease [Treponema sp.]|nr:branched-chain amino acid ABC transporter permease [Treponema sp.]
MTSFGHFLQHLTNALSLGSLYALIAIGYTMVYGILRLINFAHGEVFMLGSYIAFYAVSLFFLPWYAAFVVALGLTGIFGIGLERVAYQPLRNSPRISIMISAIGASFLMQNLAIVIFGGRPKPFPVPQLFNKVIMMGQISVMNVSLIIPVITALLLIVLQAIVHRTKTGMAMRAVSTDLPAARLMGVDVNRIVSFTFGAGSVLAAIGGIMWSLKYPQLNPSMGMIPGLKCFIAAVIGGIGNITGAVLGGLLLGFIEIMLIAALPTLTGYRDAFAFVLLIVVLLIKPSGLLGSNQIEKV